MHLQLGLCLKREFLCRRESSSAEAESTETKPVPHRHQTPSASRHVSIQVQGPRHRLLRKCAYHSGPHKTQGVCRKRAPTVRSPLSSIPNILNTLPLNLAMSDSTDSNCNRQALRHIIRNTTLPQRTRAQAQLKLSSMHAYTRSTQFKNRCTLGGRGRGIMSDFRMFRFAFRIEAMAGNITGVKKASW